MKTIIVPSSLHLVMYQKLLKEYSNTIDVQILSLNSFLYDHSEQELNILYQYQKKGESLRDSNTYKNSFNDLTFLKSCLSFIRFCKLYNVKDFPEHTQKDKDLKELLLSIYSIETKEDHIKPIIDFQSVYILHKPYNDIEMKWILFLLENGAQFIDKKTQTNFHYHSMANPKKEAKWICQSIIEKNYNACDCMIFTSQESENQVLAQMLDQYNIPYTFLKKTINSFILDEFNSVFSWIQEKTLSSFLNMIQLLYPEIYKDMNAYYTSFPDSIYPSFHLEKIEYEKNYLIEETDFLYLKNAESNIKQWFLDHDFLLHLTMNDFVSICEIIQNHHINPSIEDIKAYQYVQDCYKQSFDYLKDPFLLIQYLKQSSLTQSVKEIKGVCISSLNDCNGIRPHCFIMSANAKNFPSIVIHKDIFNENYIQNTTLPSLQKRLSFQLQQLKDTLFQMEDCFISYAQSDYEGKTVEASNDIKEWIGKDASFIDVKESSNYEKTKLFISREQAKDLFFKDSIFSVSRLESFAKCPFYHYLKYGLHLREPKSVTEVSTKGTLFHSMLEHLTTIYHKDYIHVPLIEIEKIIKDEFSFFLKVYPNKKTWVEGQIIEYSQKIHRVLQQLSEFENSWHMNIKEQEYKILKKMEFEDMTLTFTGYIDRMDTSSTSFCIFDYKSSKKELRKENFQAGLSLQLLTYTIYIEENEHLKPVGCFYISLSSPFIQDEALHISYPKDNQKLGFVEPSNSNGLDEYNRQKIISGWNFDGFDIYIDSKEQFAIPKNTLSYEECKEQWDIIVNGLLKKMKEGDIQANHVENACMYCKFQRICRNNRKEVRQISFIEEEA